MAKSKKNDIDSLFDVDDNLDMPDFEFPDFDAPDDRKPVIKVLTGALQGAKDGLRSSSFIKETLRDSLPKGFGETMDFSDKVTESLRKLYDESAKEIKPAIKDAKRLATKLISKDSTLTPKSVKNLLDKWQEEQDQERKYAYVSESKDAQRESILSSQQAEIFKVQMEQSVKNRAEDEGKDRLKQGIEMSRHTSIFSLLNRSTVALDRLDKYQSTITLGYQKKSLELQYRQLFAMQDVLSFAREDAQRKEQIYMGILKNTALPDFVKMKKSDQKKEVGGNKFSDKMFEGLYNAKDKLLEKTMKNFTDINIARVKEFTESFRSGIAQAGDAAEQTQGMGVDKFSLGGNVAGSGFAQYGGAKAAEYIKGKLGKSNNKLVTKTQGFGKKLFDMIQNSSQKLKGFKDNRDFDYESGPKAFFARLLQDYIPGMAPDTSVDNAKSKDMDAPWQLTRRTDKSINEIIPGYLARILREVQVLRTNDPSIELTHYSYDKSEFISKSKLESEIFKKVVSKDSSLRLQDSLKQMIDEVESSTGEKLKPAARKELMKILLSNSAKGNEANKENLASGKAFSKTDEKMTNQLMPVMKKFFEKQNIDGKISFDAKSNSLTNNINDPRMAIQQEINLGNIEFLKKLGVVDKDGETIDLDKIMEFMLAQTGAREISSPKDDNARPYSAGGAAFGQMAGQLKPKSGISKMVKQTGSKLDDMVDTAIAKTSKVAPKAIRRATRKVKTASEMLKRQAGGLADSAETYASELRLNALGVYADVDLYVKGEAEPRIQAVKLKAGLYKDKVTGVTVYDFKHFVNDIVDEKGNIVLYKKQFHNVVFYNVKKQVMEKVKGFKDFSKTVTLESATSAIKSAGSILEGKLDQVKDFLTPEEPSDVSIPGEPTPRLTAIKMKLGKYFDKLTNSSITHETQINGDVVDEEGKTVLEAKEIPLVRIYKVRTNSFSHIKFVGRIALAIVKGIYKFQTGWALQQTVRNFKFLGAALKFGFTATKAILDVGREAAKDVYVGDDKLPRLYATKFKSGEYTDARTGDIIYHQNEIKGPVKDSSGTVILPEDDLMKMRVFDSIFKIMNPVRLGKKALAAIGKGAWWLAKEVQAKATKASKYLLGKLGSAAAFVGKKIFNFITVPVDVYVKGDPKKKLFGTIMQAGKYFSAKTGKVISLPSEIDGPVVEGKTEVLTEEDIAKGLVDISGQPIKTSMLQKVGKVLGMLNKALSVKRLLKVDMKTLTGAKAVLADKNATTGDKTVALLTDIRDIFNKAFNKKKVLGDTDGDGIAENSFKDKQKKKKEAKDAKGKEAGGKDTKGKDKDGKPKAGALDDIEQGIIGWLKDKALSILGIGAAGVGGVKAGTTIAGAGNAAAGAASTAANATSAAANTVNAAGNVAKGASAAAEVAGGVASAAKGAGAAAETLGGAAKAATKFGGLSSILSKAAAPLAGIFEGYGEYNSRDNKNLSTADKTTKALGAGLGATAGTFGGAAGGSVIGGGIGTALGAGIGAIFGGVGAVPGALLGGKIGAGLGGLAGGYFGGTGGAKLGSKGAEFLVTRPDTEDKPNNGEGGASPDPTPAIGTLPSASGPVVDGSGASAFLKLGKNVSLNGVHPAFLKNFYGMVQEYGQLTGKSLSVSSAFRTYEQQVAEFKANPSKAAKPGNSSHEFGLAIDADKEALAEMDSMGLMRKYGLTRPVGGEPWHIEPSGIQANLAVFKRDSNKADNAIMMGLDRGGGGLGSIMGTTLGTRDDKLALSILNAPRGSNTDNKPTNAGVVLDAANGTNPNTPNALNANNSGIVKVSVNPTPATSNAGEAKPVLSSSAGVGPSPTGINPNANNMPADPTVKVPDPTGPGMAGMKDTITAAAKLVGVDPEQLLKTAAVESGFDASVKNQDSSAGGLFQFTDGTWAAMINKYGSKYGLTSANASKNDPKVASIMAAHLLKENNDTLSKKVSRAIGPTESYLAHFLGAGGASMFLNTLDQNPNVIGAQLMPDAANSNMRIFYDGTRPRTLSEIYANIDKTVRTKLASFGFSVNTPTQVAGNANNAPGTNTGSASAGSMPTAQPSGLIKASYSANQASDVSNSPIANAFSARPAQDNVAVTPAGGNNQLDKSMFASTNGILTESLSVQKMQLEFMAKIFGIVSKGTDSSGVQPIPNATQENGNPTPSYIPPTPAYTPPKSAISVKRMA